MHFFDNNSQREHAMPKSVPISIAVLAALVVLIVIAAGCSKKETPKETAVDAGEAQQTGGEAGGSVEDAGVDEPVLEMVREYSKDIDSLWGYDENGERVSYPGVSFLVQSDAKATYATKTMKELEDRLSGQGYEVFVVDKAYGMGMDRLAVLKTDDRFEILKVMQTGGYNYDIFPKDVQEKLHDWDSRFGIYMLGAGNDWAEMEFTGRPDDMDAFAKEVYEFCPDVVEQGTGSVESLAKEMDDTGTIFLWWD